MRDVGSPSVLLDKLDATFPIPLSAKTALTVLAEKLLNNGYVQMAIDNEVPVGIVGFYTNDKKGKHAFLW